MNGLDYLEAIVGGVVILLALCLASSLLGPELAIIFAGCIALSIALVRTPSPKPVRGRSRRIQPLSPSSLSKLRSAADTVLRTPVYTRKDVVVIPDSPELFQPRTKARSRPLGASARSLSFDLEA